MATPFEQWKAGIAAAKGNKAWAEHDPVIIAAVREINNHLAKTTGFIALDWLSIKAMAWVETGAASPEWKTKPLQIGVTGDPGLTSLLATGKKDEGGTVVLPPAWKTSVTWASALTKPESNIRAGIGYLMMRMASYKYDSVPVPGSQPFDVTVKPGDSLDLIGQRNGSTLDMMQKLNPTAKMLRIGQVVKCQKATLERIITGWAKIETGSIATRYNGGGNPKGDPNYKIKLDYVLTQF